jgi:vitamin B12 transporter
MFKAFFCLVSCLGFLVSGQSLAQSASDMSSDIDQIIVTGARTPLAISRIGSATTVINRDEIEQRQARYVSDLLRSVPGFSVSHSGVQGSQTQVRVRGAEANHVLVLIDGVRANDPATGDEFHWEHLTTGDIERIEIVRGAQSSLWGSDAVAAVVHVITQRDSNASVVNAYVEGGSNQTQNVGINGTLSAGNWSMNGGIESLDTNGSNISRTGSEEDGADVTTASLAARFVATDALTFNVQLRALDAYSQFDLVDFFVTGLPTDGDVATQSDNLYTNFGATLKTRGGRITHHLNARYFDSDHSNLTDGIEASSSASDRTTFAFQSDIDVDSNRLALALEHERTDFQQRGEIVFGDPNQDQSMDVTSVVAEFQGLSSERVTWLLSLRYDDNSDFDDITTGRASLAYRLSGATSLRANIGTGQKNPTFTERFGFFPGQFVGNSALKPEQSTSFDIGLDHSFLAGAFVLEASLFKQNLKDEINGFVFDPDTFLFTAENRDGKSERSGVELGARWNVNQSIGLGASYTYTDATEPDALGVDVRELRRPRHAANLSADYRSSNERFSSLLTADYGGTRDDIFFPPFPASSEIVTLQNYWLIDLTLQYQLTSTISLFAQGTNLLDDDYEQVYGYRTLGRAGYLGIRTNFGH